MKIKQNKTRSLKLFFSLKSQAAMEFLMTYGWAILIVIITVGALTSFGVLDPILYFTESRCKVYGNYYCTDFKIDGVNEQVTVVLRNGLGFEARAVTVKLSSDNCIVPGIQGAVQAINDVVVGGNINTVLGGLLYGNTITISGSGHVFDPEPEQVSESFEPFDINDYKPGGVAAAKAQAEGKYYYIDGNFAVDDDDNLEDGLYYVTRRATIDREAISNTITIAAEGKIHISAEEFTAKSYIDDLLFFSNAAGNDAIKIVGNDNHYEGYFYAPNGEVEDIGSGNEVLGGFLGALVRLGGNGLTITYVPIGEQMRSNSVIPNPWENGQTVYLNFTCLGELQRTFEGKLEVNWYTEYTYRTQYAGKRNAVGIVKGRTEQG